MRILILGGSGMLGHQLLLSLQSKHEVKLTLRANKFPQLFNNDNSYTGIDVLNDSELSAVLTDFRPEAIINCVGIIKQRPAALDIMPSLEINALFPHRLALMGRRISARVITLSTDCVFSGNKGMYTEDDLMDVDDIYGKTKFLGELHTEDCVTIRSSIIGLELQHKASLIEWFLAQTGVIKGFANAIYSGVTTMEMARIIEWVLTKHPELHGLWHVASEPISKYNLLSMLRNKLGCSDIEITRNDEFHCDRSLDGSRFANATDYVIPNWDTMLTELAMIIRERGR